LGSPEQIRAAAGFFSGIVAAGHRPPDGMFCAIIAAARVSGLLHDPAVLTAAKWQDWLHPRGKDGRFIIKDSFVNVFADDTELLINRHADRRRAKITELRPEGAYVTYYDINHQQIAADPARGYPAMIPVDELSTKVASAPQAIAHLQPDQSVAKEIADALVPALSFEEYDSELTGLNQGLRAAYPVQGGVVSTGQEPITDQEFLAHRDYIAAANQMGTGHGLTYDAAFKDSFGMWSQEIGQVFDALVDQAYNDLTKNQTKPRQQRAIMFGGLPAAGKSSTLEEMAKSEGFSEDDWITINPDYFKDLMLDRGVFPQVYGLSPAETAGFIHQASSEMGYMLEQLLTVEGYNIIFDITMGGRERNGVKTNHEQALDRLDLMDYQVDGIFVDVPPSTARLRASARHRAGLDALRTGKARRSDDSSLKFGGRTVPDTVISASELEETDPNFDKFNSLNAANFDSLKDRFVRWATWDNTGDSPELTSYSATDPTDPTQLPGYYPPGPSAPEAPAA
jgi:hypothetical protein